MRPEEKKGVKEKTKQSKMRNRMKKDCEENKIVTEKKGRGKVKQEGNQRRNKRMWERKQRGKEGKA